MASRLKGQLERMAPRVGPAADAPRSLDALRAEMARMLSREMPESAPRAEPCWPEEWDLVQEESPLGVIQIRRQSWGAGAHLGPIPLHAAREAESELLALLGLSPEWAAVDSERLLYLDTETTGLRGSGALAFLIGLAWFEGERLCMEQLLLPSPADEGALLERVRERIEWAHGLVTFNGKSFDMPLLLGRTVMNRREAFPSRPHLDLLHVARRLHRPRLARIRLVELEDHVLGQPRSELDISGADIAPRYAHYLRSRDPAELIPVIEHNSSDVLSMVALVGLYGEPSGQLMAPGDMAQAASVLKRGRAWDRALGWAEAASAAGALAGDRALAQIHKARGDRALALKSFEKYAAEVDDPAVRLELCKLYEHFAKDFDRALELAELGTGETTEALARRRARIERKTRTTRT